MRHCSLVETNAHRSRMRLMFKANSAASVPGNRLPLKYVQCNKAIAASSNRIWPSIATAAVLLLSPNSVVASLAE